MNIETMCKQTVNLYRQYDAKRQFIWKDTEHLSSILVSLNIHLGQLAEVCGLDYTKIDGITDSSKELRLEKLVVVMQDFILLSTICNWTDKLSISEKETKRLTILPKDDKNQLNILYLSIENMLLKSFYEKDVIAFCHAWILFLKWGKTDLNFTENEIQVAFQKKIEKDLKLI
ncbi:hypothetical protein BGL41_00475 [Fructilactobacillus sanfranciscensis]|uniref:hypothetical protein n=1 Tax=Fructilactobacillus sanfranciscensis TaxID=1625 RepID=UPI000CD46644|nr:hypothetical protein [Fructilactobacillus sanfranciscensis]POH15581.1 hypothetical protein BGL41_00475 [Fructilactobacillus sanfranciscensis]